jgi:lysophospholipase L1-like esterase
MYVWAGLDPSGTFASAMRGVFRFTGALLLFLLLTGCGKPDAPPTPATPGPVMPFSSAAPTPKVITMIGDSYTSGTPDGGLGAKGWPSLVSVRLRSDGIATAAKIAAEAGSGYVTAGHAGHTFGQLAESAVQPHDDLVIYFGDLNDGYDGGLDIEQATAAVNETFTKTRDTADKAKLLVIGPVWPSTDPPPPYAVALNQILRDQASLVGATFLDAIEERWLQGEPALVAPDQMQPNDAGHSYLADRIETLISTELT